MLAFMVSPLMSGGRKEWIEVLKLNRPVPGKQKTQLQSVLELVAV
jgi:hypothetical protein